MMRHLTSLSGTAVEPQPGAAELHLVLQSLSSLDPALDADAPIARTLATIIWKARQSKPARNHGAPVCDNIDHGVRCHSRCAHAASVKEQVLARSDYLCACCGEWAHSVYERDEVQQALAGDDRPSMVAVCRRCFDYIHEDPLTRRERMGAAEREAALADIYGQGTDSPIFRLLTMLENYRKALAASLIC